MENSLTLGELRIAKHRQTITELITQVPTAQEVQSAVEMVIQTNIVKLQKMQKTVQNITLLQSNLSSQEDPEMTRNRSTKPFSIQLQFCLQTS